jgi:RimJ/RimL family protein N-acetyltransferase
MAAFPDELVGPRLRLRRWTLEDIDDLFDAVAVSFPELHQWMAWAAMMPTREFLTSQCVESVARFDADDQWSYFLREIHGDQLVGSAGLHRRGADGELEIGYWVRSDRTGRGYASEASGVLTNAAFDADLGISMVKITMDRANAASAAVPRRLGFERDQEFERDVAVPGHSGGAMAWVLTREAWESRPTER